MLGPYLTGLDLKENVWLYMGKLIGKDSFCGRPTQVEVILCKMNQTTTYMYNESYPVFNLL